MTEDIRETIKKQLLDKIKCITTGTAETQLGYIENFRIFIEALRLESTIRKGRDVVEPLSEQEH